MKHFLALAFIGILMTVGLDVQANTDKDKDKLEKRVKVPTDVVKPALRIDPYFPGGKKAFSKFLKDHIEYPAKAERQKKQGTVRLRLDIDKNGRVTNFYLSEPMDESFGDQLTQLFHDMPSWLPAIGENGERIPSRVFIDINFKLIK